MTDLELQTRVAEFVGWTELHTEDVSDPHSATRCIMLCGRRPGGVHARDIVDDYVNSVDAWLSDVAPQMSGLTRVSWINRMSKIFDTRIFDAINASARDRCIALVKMLDERGAQSK